MEPALPLPLRLDISHPPFPLDHPSVADNISLFLSSYAARTGTHNAASTDDAGSGSTGGVVAAQLTRLMNGLRGRIDYDFTSLLTGAGSSIGTGSGPGGAPDGGDEVMEVEEGEEVLETPVEVLEETARKRRGREEGDGGDGEGMESFSRGEELTNAETPTVDDSLREDPMEERAEGKRKKDKKEKKDKKQKREKIKKEA